MRIVWGHPEGALFAQVQEELAQQGTPCHANALIVLFSRLQKKGYLRAEKKGRRNVYTALIQESAYQEQQTQLLVDKAYGGSTWGLVANLVTGDKLTEAEYAELRELLRSRRPEP
ncbi:MAG: BlaI/MecI/CopY family transcriptional regulator [Clostridia bacterium]|nr:BlaI/MecI/CopY family transcriptional regulator [Clostridia bacterium]